MKTALVAGSFDPITLGHYDIIARASALFDQVVVCILNNASKQGHYPIEKRIDFLKTALADLPNVCVDYSDALLADYVAQKNIDVVVKGVRNTTDFEYEWNMAVINRQLNHKLETLFLPAKTEYLHISSSLVRELLRHNKPVNEYLPVLLRNTKL